MGNEIKKHRIKLWDKYVRIQFYKLLSFISVIFALLFIPPIENCMESITWKGTERKAFFVVYLVFLILSYLLIWFRVDRKKSVVIKINNNKLEVRKGDIFAEPDNVWKVIGVNEYFDTLVGGKEQLVAEQSLHGKYLNRFYQNDVEELDVRIADEFTLMNKITNRNRKIGKQEKYPLGTIFCDVSGGKKYLLAAFSKTDKHNRAYISMKDYINFLIKFWMEIDKVYNGCSISIPLFGSGIVRFREQDVSHQELLEVIVWTFKNSHIKMAYGSKVSIILFGDDIEKVDLYKLKQME